MAGGGSTVKEMTKSFGKLDKFQGQDFRRWQKKMHFMLTTLKVVYVLSTPIPELEEDETVENLRRRSKWENDDYICRGHILNGMSDPLFDIYQNVESAKELWDCLEAKYMADDSSSKKFLVTDFNNYKMVESRSVMEQFNELLRILGQFTQHGLKMDETISVSSIIDKLPPSWKDFKHNLKHGKDELSLVQLGSHLRIEESLRAHEDNKGKGKEIAGPSVNMIEEGEQATSRRIAALVKSTTTRTQVVQERGLRTNPETKDDAIAWWIDSGATTHVCKDRFWFKTFVPVEDGSILYMGDDHFAPVEGKGNVVLEFSSGKTITLFNVLYVPKLRFGYYNNGMFMMNLNGVPKDSGSIFIPKISIPNSDESLRDDHSYDKPSETLEPRRSKRARKSRSYGSDFQLYLVEGSKDQIETQYYYCYSIEEDPRTYDEAVKSRDSIFWKEAIDEEIGSIMENNTWVLSYLPPGCKPLGCKWIFKKKMKVDGTIDKFKARLVIQGFRQKEGIDYFDTYAPVARITTIRLLIALAAIHNLVIHQMDVKTTFLNGDLEEVYMKQPEGFVMPGNEHKVCKLVKSLYGLKQAPKQWHQKFDEVVLSNDFILNQADKCLYSKFDSSGKGVFICLYVDDMLIFGTNQNQVDKTKNFLSSKFSMKDMGEADVILGIKIKRENKGIVITQSHYIEKILKKFNYENCSPVSTPMDPGEKLMPNTAVQNNISNTLGVQAVLGTSKYLSLPSLIGRSKKSTFNFIKDKVWKKINSWSSKCLSKAGREVLIKSVLQSIPTYFMSIFTLPSSPCDEIEKMMNSFWWGHSGAQNRGINWMSWEKLAMHKNDGGMGFKHLSAFNLAMLGCRWRIGDCNNIPLWNENWLVVALPLEPINNIDLTYSAARILATPLYPSVTDDRRLWRGESKSEYSVKSAYRICVQELIDTSHLRVNGNWNLEPLARKWRKSMVGRVKYNIDASFPANSDKVDIGICIRDEHSAFILAKTEWLNPKSEVHIGEALSLLSALD
ncbi:hypothetical protein TSUD_187020 [Trifolium subterraneum]|uniref:Uncharacterized protein n=1 Tax=Trifolium subterraneum TaxID=3900 RepID=A0A2Z6PIS6_TRISU|nr:hypothetical protein TSUD_187020 [Trifolium subterraneum]